MHKGHSKDMLFSLKWRPIHDRIKFCKATMVYKSVNDLVPNYMKICLHMCEIHILVQQGLLLRMIYTFQLVNIKNCTFKALPIVVLIYGTLSILTFTISLNSFKNAYIKDYFSVYTTTF